MSQRTHAAVGRPRAVQRDDPSVAPEEDILQAAAGLFAKSGFGGTSTRAIAEASGIRQATLYYYFSGKDAILRELLARTVKPSLEMARGRLADLEGGADPIRVLYELAANDATILLRAGEHQGVLYSLPEVWGGNYPEFVTEHDELVRIYGSAAAAASARQPAPFPLRAGQLGQICIRIVESTYEFEEPVDEIARLAGGLCLRLCGVPETRIAQLSSAE